MALGLTLSSIIVTGAPAAGGEPLPRGSIVFTSNRAGGRQQVWVSNPDGGSPRQLTTDGGRCPAWATDGSLIAYTAADRSTRVIRPDGTEIREVCPPGRSFQFWASDSRGLVCGDGQTFYRVDVGTGAANLLVRRSSHPKLGYSLTLGGMTQDGRWLIAFTDHILTYYTYDNGIYFSDLFASVVLDRDHPDKLYFVGPGCGATLSPTEDRIFHISVQQPLTRPDVFSLMLADLETRSSYQPEVARPDADWGHEYMVQVSTDGKWLTYAATTGCHDFETCDYEIFLHRLGDAGSRTRVTTDPATEQWPHLFVEGSGELRGRVLDRTALRRLAAPPLEEPTISGGGGCTVGGRSAPGGLAWLVLAAFLVCRRQGAYRRDCA